VTGDSGQIQNATVISTDLPSPQCVLELTGATDDRSRSIWPRTRRAPAPASSAGSRCPPPCGSGWPPAAPARSLRTGGRPCPAPRTDWGCWSICPRATRPNRRRWCRSTSWTRQPAPWAEPPRWSRHRSPNSLNPSRCGCTRRRGSPPSGRCSAPPACCAPTTTAPPERPARTFGCWTSRTARSPGRRRSSPSTTSHHPSTRPRWEWTRSMPTSASSHRFMA